MPDLIGTQWSHSFSENKPGPGAYERYGKTTLAQ